MPDALPVDLSSVERKLAADRLWAIVALIDSEHPMCAIRDAVKFTAMAMENPVWMPKDQPIEVAHD